jgi:hypothetical protein
LQGAPHRKESQRRYLVVAETASELLTSFRTVTGHRMHNARDGVIFRVGAKPNKLSGIRRVQMRAELISQVVRPRTATHGALPSSSPRRPDDSFEITSHLQE